MRSIYITAVLLINFFALGKRHLNNREIDADEFFSKDGKPKVFTLDDARAGYMDRLLDPTDKFNDTSLPPIDEYRNSRNV